MSMEDWFELPREEKIRTLFDYPSDMRNKQVRNLWGKKAFASDRHVTFPANVPWSEIVEVVKLSHSEQTAKLPMEKEYFSNMDWTAFQHLMTELNIPGKVCKINPRYADREYRAFNIWRAEMLDGRRRCNLNIQLRSDNKLLLFRVTNHGDYGDEQGYGMEPDMYSSGLFGLDGSVIVPFRPGLIGDDDDR